jgi:hypothetical protein
MNFDKVKVGMYFQNSSKSELLVLEKSEEEIVGIIFFHEWEIGVGVTDKFITFDNISELHWNGPGLWRNAKQFNKVPELSSKKLVTLLFEYKWKQL